jgi:hypothetical protein
MMPKFRKKPVEVEAYQITIDLLEPILFNGVAYPTGLVLGSSMTYPPDRSIKYWYGYVTTIHGQETKVEVGDWIITEPDGKHFYP